MKKLSVFFLSAAMAATAALGLAACRTEDDTPLPSKPFTPRESATVTVFTTNDMHGNLAGDGKSTIGVVQAAAIKASTPNSLLVDAGDATQGASFASVSRGADVVRMMNEAGYDLMAVGNHEFDYGTDVLLENAELANFPILAANVVRDGKPLLESSTVVTVAGYKIGFIGLTTVSTATSTNPTLLTGVTFEDEVETAKTQIAALKDETDAIVLVCHMGDNDKAVSCTSEQLLMGLSQAEQAEVTAVIDGHSHTVEEKLFTSPQGGENGVQRVKGIPILQTGVNFTNLGKLTLSFRDSETGANVSAEGEVLDYAAAMNITTTEAGEQKAHKVQETLDAVKLQQDEILGEVLCGIDHPLFGGYVCYNYVESRVVETSYGDFVTDAFRYYAERFAENEALGLPVVAVENGGGISQSLPTWHSGGTNVTRGDVLSAFNHGNLVEVLKVSPAELFAAIEAGLVTTGQDESGLLLRERVSGSFLQCSGFSYTYDPAGEAGNKVVEVRLTDGTVLDRTDTENKLLLATNNYVSSSFAKGEKLGELGGEDILIEDYILYLSGQNGGILDYKCTYDRIKIENDRSPETYTVKLRVMRGDAPQTSQTFHLIVDGVAPKDGAVGGEAGDPVTTDSEGYFTVTLPKGAHTLYLAETDNYVYVNNYSGTGVAEGSEAEPDFYTKEGYYCFYFYYIFDKE